MAIAYHIDRSNSLHENQILDLIPIDPMCQSSIQFQMSQFSVHGLKYVDYYNQIVSGTLSIFSPAFMNESQMESFLEALRRTTFPDMPSRLQSIFCIPNLSNLNQWFELLKTSEQSCAIWEIEYSPSRAVLVDERFLRGNTMGGTISEMGYENYVKYWMGQKSDDPLMELVVQLPVKVVRRIK